MKNKSYLLLFALASLAAAGCSDGSGSTNPADMDFCPMNDAKTAPGICGCDMSDDDSDGDGLEDCFDLCPNDPKKIESGACGCGVSDEDLDGNTIPDCLDKGADLCPDDINKTAPGVCGCGKEDVDTDGDGVLDCMDLCPEDPDKVQGQICGCGTPDLDSDNDGFPDCIDQCEHDALKIIPGICGCEKTDSYINIKDTDGDGVEDCRDLCPTNPYKTAPGESGCEVSDSDGDGVDDPYDDCPYNPNVQSLAEGDNRNKCNYTTENGEKIFEIWSADDLGTLRAELKTLMPEAPVGMPCDDSYQLACTGGVSSESDATASRCSADPNRVVEIIHCYDGCVVKEDAADICMAGTVPAVPESVPEKCTETSSPSALYDCCTAENFADQCGKEGVLTCSNGMVRIKTACPAVCHEAACAACIPVAEDESNKGQEGTCCDEKTFVESCSGNSAIRCIAGRVQKVECSESCIAPANGARYAGCFVSAEMEKPIIKVRVMRDIDISESHEAKIYTSVGCSGSWEPISLYRVDFNGNGKTIRFTDGTQTCALNNAVFDFIHDSKVRNLSIEYNLEGAIVGVLARGISHSQISGIAYNGTVHLTAAAYGETLDKLAGIANGVRNNAAHYGMLAPWIMDSSIADINAAGTLVNDSKNQSKFGVVAGAVIDSKMTGIQSKMNRLSCAGASCGSTLFSGSNLVVNDVTVDIDRLNGSNVISGFAASTAGIKNIQNVNITIKNIEHSSTFLGFGDVITDIASSNIKIEKMANTAETAEDKLAEFNGIGTSAVNISNVDVDIKNSTHVNVYAIARDGAASVSNSKVQIADVQGKNAVAALFSKLSNSKLNKVTVDIDKVDAASVNLSSTASASEISELTWTSKNITASKSAALFANLEKSSVSASAIELGSVKLTAADVVLSGVANTLNEVNMVDTQIHVEKLEGASTVYGLAENVSNDSVIEYTGVQIDEMFSGTSTGSMIGTLNGTLSNVAFYAVMKVLAPGEEKTADVYGVAKTIGKGTLKDVVSMARMYSYTKGESEAIGEVSEIKAHQIFAAATTPTYENNWWFKRSEEHSGQEILVGEENKSPSAFTASEVDDVIKSFAENSWTKKNITEDGAGIDLPWPGVKPEVKEESKESGSTAE